MPPPPFPHPLISQQSPCLYGDGRGRESLIIHEKKRASEEKKAASVLVLVSNITLIFLQDYVTRS